MRQVKEAVDLLEVMPKYLTMVSYTPEGIKGLVKEGGTARRAVVVDDLERSRAGFFLARVATRFLSASDIVHADGPLSVEGAFTVEEARGLAARAQTSPRHASRGCPSPWSCPFCPQGHCEGGRTRERGERSLRGRRSRRSANTRGQLSSAAHLTVLPLSALPAVQVAGSLLVVRPGAALVRRRSAHCVFANPVGTR